MKSSLIVSLGLIVLSISIASLGQLLIKVGMNEVGWLGSNIITDFSGIFKKVILNWQIVLGFVLYGLAAAAWLVVLSRVDLSFAYPFAGLGYIIVIFLAWLFLKEPLNFYRVSGSLIIFLGLVTIARGY